MQDEFSHAILAALEIFFRSLFKISALRYGRKQSKSDPEYLDHYSHYFFGLMTLSSGSYFAPIHALILKGDRPVDQGRFAGLGWGHRPNFGLG